jgi:hypothetical protein
MREKTSPWGDPPSGEANFAEEASEGGAIICVWCGEDIYGMGVIIGDLKELHLVH